MLTKSEHKAILKIRNLAHIREVSGNSNIILLKNHLEWVKTLNKNKRFYAVFFNNKIIGGVSFEKREIPTWAIFFDKTQPFVSLMAIYIFLEYLFQEVDILEAKLKKNNKLAYKFNKFFGIDILEFDENYYLTQITKKRWEENKQKLKLFNKNIEYKFEG